MILVIVGGEIVITAGGRGHPLATAVETEATTEAVLDLVQGLGTDIHVMIEETGEITGAEIAVPVAAAAGEETAVDTDPGRKRAAPILFRPSPICALKGTYF